MRLTILALMVISAGIMLLQNQQSITLYFLGTDAETALFSLGLPLGLWILIFTIAGIISSLFIQLFTRSSRLLSFKKPINPSPRLPDPPETPYQRPEPKQSDWERSSPPEWEKSPQDKEDDDEWEIEEPPIEKTIPRRPPQGENTRSEFEIQQPPKTASQEGTVYSYTYRELSDRVSSDPSQSPPKLEKKPQSSSSQTRGDVYDAQYRIITPPYQPSQESNDEDGENEEDEENWI